jgi:hypothetical protein
MRPNCVTVVRQETTQVLTVQAALIQKVQAATNNLIGMKMVASNADPTTSMHCRGASRSSSRGKEQCVHSAAHQSQDWGCRG